ncbi:OLC1v1031630C1 [Oldenlandia corymbosa var. corymbosa]|uniref:OLC1v1031630C1 n=1 Tax=Oldenlandia corymbosa var. corymbosa TaxID=529605 RepID=A0AAV1CJV7_OLDCO|nr:OLC1v1031630C1 [Oldenlandia corymbosa var. corymbosa]
MEEKKFRGTWSRYNALLKVARMERKKLLAKPEPGEINGIRRRNGFENSSSLTNDHKKGPSTSQTKKIKKIMPPLPPETEKKKKKKQKSRSGDTPQDSQPLPAVEAQPAVNTSGQLDKVSSSDHQQLQAEEEHGVKWENLWRKRRRTPQTAEKVSEAAAVVPRQRTTKSGRLLKSPKKYKE